MAHPYKDKAFHSHKAKTHGMGKSNNLDIPIMRAIGENSARKTYSSSSGSQQHKEQSAASGYKRGGHVGKHRSKPKVAVIAAGAPPAPDPTMAAAGAASPAPAPMPPGQPPMKHGGKVSGYARGGRAYPKDGGAENGMGRLGLTKLQARKKK